MKKGQKPNLTDLEFTSKSETSVEMWNAMQTTDKIGKESPSQAHPIQIKKSFK